MNRLVILLLAGCATGCPERVTPRFAAETAENAALVAESEARILEAEVRKLEAQRRLKELKKTGD